MTPIRQPTPHELRFAVDLTRELAAQLPDEEILIETFGRHALMPVSISFAPQKHWWHWVPVEVWLGHFLTLLSQPIDKPKDELPLYVPGRLTAPVKWGVNQRLYSNVESVSLCVLDYDKGDAPFEALINRARHLGLCAFVYRSPSDGKNTSMIKRFNARGETLCDPTVEACRRKLLKEGFDPTILGDVHILDEHFADKDGAACIVVGHNPIAKTRLVIVLTEPFTRRPGEPSRDFASRWRCQVMEPLAHALGFVADTSRFDINGAFYFPRLLEGAVTEYVPGQPLDLNGHTFAEWRNAWEEPRCRGESERRARAIERRAAAHAGGRASTIDKRYALADLTWDCANDRVRADRREQKEGLIECECPFDELHSNAGDESDRAFYITNSGSAGCLHSHKDEHCTNDYIAKILADGWFSADQLAAYELPPKKLQLKKPEWII